MLLGDLDPQASVNVSHLYLPATSLSHLQRLVAIVAQLRSPQGCPWDQAQTPLSLTSYILEEAYETVTAIRQGHVEAIAEELGDLLLQVVLQSQIFSESQTFDLEQVAAGIADKLIRRHPHVFAADGEASPDVEEVHRNWEQIKQSEQPQQTLAEKLWHDSQTLPPLMAALKISNRVVRAGFEWPNAASLWAKVAEEEAELQEVLDRPLPEAENQREFLRQQQAGELGDLIFTLVNLGRWYGLDASAALQQTNEKFARRFQMMATLLAQSSPSPDRTLTDCTLTELEALWQQTKQQHP
ncbi:MAG: nucleoside triphosphate pyrophosphohydrolase [Synechococcaceae cyanobacterium SM2_3_1]|nr:nucleoside triphosphate pyrophosphohydrolase [Synechococcaceae cyanobacterium SM2_3_1]